MTKKNLFTLVLCLFCFGTTTHAQRIPTLEEAVYGGLIKTEGGSNVNWMKDGERYSKIEKKCRGSIRSHCLQSKGQFQRSADPCQYASESANRKTYLCPQFRIQRG